jgi:hypothetical protein
MILPSNTPRLNNILRTLRIPLVIRPRMDLVGTRHSNATNIPAFLLRVMMKSTTGSTTTSSFILIERLELVRPGLVSMSRGSRRVGSARRISIAPSRGRDEHGEDEADEGL